MSEHRQGSSDTATEPTTEQLQKRKRWRRWVVWGPILALLSAVALAIFVLFVADPGRPLTVGPETTYVTGPVKPDGRIDYVRALKDILAEKRKQEGVTPETNAVVPLLRAVGPGDIYELAGPQFFEQLGIAPLPKAGPYFVAYLDFIEASRGEELTYDTRSSWLDRHGAAMERPWSRDEFRLVAEWLDKNEEPLEHAIEASRREHFYQPLIIDTDGPPPRLVGSLLPLVQACRDLSRALRARAMLKISEGHPEAAWDDILAVYRLAVTLSRSTTIIDKLVASALEALAFDSTVALLDTRDLDESLALRMLQDLRDLPAPQSAGVSVDIFERIAYIEALQAFIDGQWDDDDEKRSVWDSAKRRMAIRMADWDRIARDLNHWYDRAADALSDPSPKGTAALERLMDETEAAFRGRGPFPTDDPGHPTSGTTREMERTALAQFLPAFESARQAWDRRAAERRLIRAALMVRLHQLQTGRFPERLSDVLPADEIEDRFAGKPFAYRSDKNGFVLYTVGTNGVDDGGAGFEDGSNTTDDLAVRVDLTRDDQ